MWYDHFFFNVDPDRRWLVPKEVRNSRKHAGALRGSVGWPFSGVSTGPVLMACSAVAEPFATVAEKKACRVFAAYLRRVAEAFADMWPVGGAISLRAIVFFRLKAHAGCTWQPSERETVTSDSF